MDSNQNNSIEIHLPKVKKTYIDMVMKLGKDSIAHLLHELRYYFRDHKAYIASADSKQLQEDFTFFFLSPERRNLLKEKFAELYCSLSADLRNVYHIATGDIRLMAAWNAILNSVEIDSDSISSIIGRDMVIGRPSYWGHARFPEVIFSPLSVIGEIEYENDQDYRYFHRSFRLSLLPSIRAGLVRLFYGEDIFNPEVNITIPDVEDYTIEDYENDMEKDLSFMSGLALSDSIALGGGIVTAANLKVIKKRWSFREYLSSSPVGDIDRAENLLNAYNVYHSKHRRTKKDKEMSVSPDKFGLYVVKELPKVLTDTHLATFFPMYKGITKSWAGNVDTASFTNVITTMLRPAAEGWMPMKNFKLRFLCMPLERKWANEYYNSLFNSYEKSKNTLKRRDNNKPVVPYTDRTTSVDWYREIDFPFIVNWIRFLCGCGLLELAIKKGWEKDENFDKNLKGISYVRMTPLGRYVFGFSRTYEAKRKEIVAGIEVDSRNGILTLDSSENPYSLFLSQICVPISSTRFRLTAESIINGCENVSDVESRVKNLENILGKKDTNRLQDILKEVEERLHCEIPIQTDYLLIRLNPALPRLIDLVMNSEEIRSRVVLAEQSMMLVEKDFFPKFRKICQENGFMINP